jgi:hypothetical protein
MDGLRAEYAAARTVESATDAAVEAQAAAADAVTAAEEAEVTIIDQTEPAEGGEEEIIAEEEPPEVTASPTPRPPKAKTWWGNYS